MKVIACNPRGYCLGVIKAISLAIKTKEEHIDKDVYIYGMLVHNEDVIKYLNKKNIITLEVKEDFNEVVSSLKEESYLIFTAHGHDKKLEEIAINHNLNIVDATCERVKENMLLLEKETNENKESIYIGKKNHPEATAALSISNKIKLYEIGKEFDFTQINDSDPLVINQTTLSFLDLKNEHENIKKNLPNARIIDEICDATYLRQKAILNLDENVDFIYVVGGNNSSNTNKLVEIAKSKFTNIPVKRILNKNEIKKNDLDGHFVVAVISGTSTPLEITNEVINYLKSI